MDNLVYVNNAMVVNKIFEVYTTKLIVMLFYIKTKKDCIISKSIVEQLAPKYKNVMFLLIDIESLNGESRYCNNISNIPRFDFYFSNNLIGTYSGSDEKIIENNVIYCEQNIMSRINQNNVISSTPTVTPINTTPVIPTHTIPDYLQTNNMPNGQQIQQMFNIFQMMQQLGILNNQNITPQNQKDKSDTIILSNGDKIIPLADGKYGLIKKK